MKKDIDNVYDVLRWSERIGDLNNKKGESGWALKVVRGVLVAFASYIILVLAFDILNNILYSLSKGTKYFANCWFYLIFPSIFLGVAFMLFPVKE
ncbi:MAG: hypothetical protein CO114_04245 [Euryarchaeota archaeon CG_4_9_14_3_um_filter_38_12]|nr:MAG: hypothetical protein CO114_04245 [Euryarchaeota archaeon CG_4_9_14_3_um_filter_38_12]